MCLFADRDDREAPSHSTKSINCFPRDLIAPHLHINVEQNTDRTVVIVLSLLCEVPLCCDVAFLTLILTDIRQ